MPKFNFKTIFFIDGLLHLSIFRKLLIFFMIPLSTIQVYGENRCADVEVEKIVPQASLYGAKSLNFENDHVAEKILSHPKLNILTRLFQQSRGYFSISKLGFTSNPSWLEKWQQQAVKSHNAQTAVLDISEFVAKELGYAEIYNLGQGSAPGKNGFAIKTRYQKREILLGLSFKGDAKQQSPITAKIVLYTVPQKSGRNNTDWALIDRQLLETPGGVDVYKFWGYSEAEIKGENLNYTYEDLTARKEMAQDIAAILMAKFSPTLSASAYLTKDFLSNVVRGLNLHDIEAININIDEQGSWLVFYKSFIEILALSAKDFQALRSQIPEITRTQIENKLLADEQQRTAELEKQQRPYKALAQHLSANPEGIGDFLQQLNIYRKTKKHHFDNVDSKLSDLTSENFYEDKSASSYVAMPKSLQTVLELAPKGTVPESARKLLQEKVLPKYNELEKPLLIDFFNLCAEAGLSYRELAGVLKYFNENAPKIIKLGDRHYSKVFYFIFDQKLLAEDNMQKLLRIYFRDGKTQFDARDPEVENFLVPVFSRAQLVRKLLADRHVDWQNSGIKNLDLTQAIPNEILEKLFSDAPYLMNRLGFAWDVIGSEMHGAPPPELLLLPEFAEFLKGQTQTNENFSKQMVLMLDNIYGISSTEQIPGFDRLESKMFRQNVFQIIKWATDLPEERLTKRFYVETYRENSWNGGQQRDRSANVVQGMMKIISKDSKEKEWFAPWVASMGKHKAMQRLIRYLINEPRDVYSMPAYVVKSYDPVEDSFLGYSTESYNLKLSGVSKVMSAKMGPEEISKNIDKALELNYSYYGATNLTVVASLFGKKVEQVIQDLQKLGMIYREKSNNPLFNSRNLDSINLLKILYASQFPIARASELWNQDFKASTQALLYFLATGKNANEYQNHKDQIEKQNETPPSQGSSEQETFEQSLTKAFELFAKYYGQPPLMEHYQTLHLWVRSVEFVFSLGLNPTIENVTTVAIQYKNHRDKLYYGHSNYGYYFLKLYPDIVTAISKEQANSANPELGAGAALFTLGETVPW